MLGIKIDGVALPVDPFKFQVIYSDLDDGESTTRAADGTLTRDRIATKVQLQLNFNTVKSTHASTILTMVKPVFFTVKYPDPEANEMLTKTFYSGNRPAAIAVSKPDGLYWNGLDFTLIER